MLFLCGLFAAAATAQGFDIGIRGGVPFVPFVLDHQAGSRLGSIVVESQPRRYYAGPVVDIQPAPRWSIETGLIYRRFGYDARGAGFSFQTGATSFVQSATGNSWEIPVVWKPRIRLWGAHMFIGAGFAIRAINGIDWREHRETQAPLSPPPPRIEDTSSGDPQDLNRRSAVGAVLTSGLEWNAGRFRFTPEFRYTHWDSPRAGDSSNIRYQRDQVEGGVQIFFEVFHRSRKPMLSLP